MWRSVVVGVLLWISFSAGLVQGAERLLTEETVDFQLAQLSLEEKVGQLFMVAFRQEAGTPITTVTPRVRDSLQRYHLGGVILFAENFVNVPQTVKLTTELQGASGNVPLFLAVDQEGGRVNRFHFGTELPGNMAMGASSSPDNAYAAGKILGSELAAMGMNVDLAPVQDVNSNQDNPVIGIRSFGADANLVARLGERYIQGLHDAKVMAAVKHFPGHGDTSVDSHLGLPRVMYEKSRLQAVELKPFYENRSIADMIMVAHVAFPALDDTKVLSKKDGEAVSVPATLSYAILTKLLREELAYEGVIITDALEMKAITEHFGAEDTAVRAIQAGADILLMPSNLEKAYQGIMTAVQEGRISETRINQSVKRILRLKQQWLYKASLPMAEQIDKAKAVVGNAEHKIQERKIAGEAVTLLKNEKQALPLPMQGNHTFLLAASRSDLLEAMTEAAQQEIGEGKTGKWIPLLYGKSDTLTTEEKRAVDSSDYVVLATYSSTLASRTPGQSPAASFAAELVTYARLAGKKTVVLALGTPYDILYLREADGYLALYGANAANLHAGMAAMFGHLNPKGTLPVSIEEEGTILFPRGYGLSYPVNKPVR